MLCRESCIAKVVYVVFKYMDKVVWDMYALAVCCS